MSAKLIGNLGGRHDLQDDLESSLYVLLWTALMFSECSGNTYIAPFMAHVIDPQPHAHNGGLGKQDFLQTRSYLQHLKFPHRSVLDILIDQLAKLFSVHYEAKPEKSETERALKLQQQSIVDPSFVEIYHSSYSYQFASRMTSLMDPANTIALFDSALYDRSKWPANDRATKQQIYRKKPSPQWVTKTGWSMTLIMEEMSGDHEMKFDNEEVGEDEEYQMVGVEKSSEIIDLDVSVDTFGMVGVETSLETIDSDQATVNGLSSTLLPGDLRP
jgi:hypothetical protein